MSQLGLDFAAPPKVESVTQLALGFVRQIPLAYLEGQRVRALENPVNIHSYDKEAVIRALMDLRIALAALDSGLGFDPSRFEVPYAVLTTKEP